MKGPVRRQNPATCIYVSEMLHNRASACFSESIQKQLVNKGILLHTLPPELRPKVEDISKFVQAYFHGSTVNISQTQLMFDNATLSRPDEVSLGVYMLTWGKRGQFIRNVTAKRVGFRYRIIVEDSLI